MLNMLTNGQLSFLVDYSLIKKNSRMLMTSSSDFLELFKPAKIDPNARWNPVDRGNFIQNTGGKPKAKLRDIGDIMHQGGSEHRTYHIPPGEYVVQILRPGDSRGD